MSTDVIFSRKILDGLSSDPAEAAAVVAAAYVRWRDRNKTNSREEHMTIIDAYAHAKALAQTAKWGDFGAYAVSGKLSDDVTNIDAQFKQLQLWGEANLEKTAVLEQFEASAAKYASDAFNPIEYRFDAEQLTHIQQLVNEIRESLTDLDGIPENWRTRMLRRVEALQRELHERMNSMDRFWGFLGEAIPVVYSLGVAARPVVNRLRELAEIVLRVTATIQGLPPPPGVPLLPAPEADPEMPKLERRVIDSVSLR